MTSVQQNAAAAVGDPATTAATDTVYTPRHLPALDGLRAIAVLLVMWCHIPIQIPGYPEWLAWGTWLLGPGALGVEIFFVLSGFLITRLLLAERAVGSPLRWFLLRRLFRIFPIYYLLLLVMLPLRPAAEIGWCAAYLHNLDAILHPGETPLGHTWSLCVEEHFYLLWPPVVAFTKPATAARVLMWFVMPFALLVAIVVAATVDDPGTVMNIVQHGSPCRFLGLGAGCLLAFHERTLFSSAGRSALLIAGCAVVALPLYPHFVFLLGPWWFGTGEWLAQRWLQPVWLLHSAALCTTIVGLTVATGAARLSPMRLLTTRPLRAIGRISYGLYLYHYPIYTALVLTTPTPLRAAAAIAATFAVATVSYWLIERPLLRYASRFRRTRGPS